MTAGSGASPDARLQVRGDTYTKAQIQVLSTHNDDNPATLQISKSRSGGNTILGDNDDIGQINFAGNDGNGFHNVGRIMVTSSGEGNGDDDLPTVMRFFTTANGGVSLTERMRISSDGNVKFNHGLTGLVGGGVIVAAAKSSSGTANQSNYKVDFVVPMGDLGNAHEYSDIRGQFSSGQTGVDWTHAKGGSGILIATVQNDYYWGYRTKIYHITTYGNSSNNVTSLNLLHNYSAAGHGSNSASVDLAVQSHDGKTPKLRATFSGDYWNSNVLTVTFIGSSVASTGNIRQLTSFDSKLTGQDTAWK